MRSIYFLTKPTKDSGNYQTTSRISKLLKISFPGVNIKNLDPASLATTEESCPILIGIHLRRIGDVLMEYHKSKPRSEYKLISICGGTDLFEEYSDPVKLSIMKKVVKQSKVIVVFNEPMRDRFKQIWPEFSGTLQMIPQSIDLQNPPKIIEQRNKIFLWIGRLRSVKDPNTALEYFVHWKRKSPVKALDYKLLFIGSVEENDSDVQKFLSNFDNECQNHLVERIDSIDRRELHDMMRTSTLLINSSRNEGQCLTIMEAQLLGLPVIAKRSPGNEALVDHMETGCLFSNHEEFSDCIDFILDGGKMISITEKAREFACRPCFSGEAERESFGCLINSISLSDTTTINHSAY